EDGLAVRRAVAQDLEQIASGRAGAVDVAQRWTNDGQADQRLRHAADLVLAQASAGLTDPSRLHKLVTWFDAANRTRDLLRTTVRADLAVTELLLSWREGERQPRSRGTR
ncbi:DNA polymerase III subunit delta', partial [Xanthomonas oryzae pv. oryzae]